MRDLNIDIPVDWNIYNTRAVVMLQKRVTELKRIPETIRTQVNDKVRDVLGQSVEQGWSRDKLIMEMTDGMKDTYNIAQNRAQTIAKTELGGVFNDSRLESFLDVGVTEHEWAHSTSGQIKHPREDHLISERRHIGETFSNGLLYPHDPSGSAEQVINCNCLTYPVVED
jgi:hypothetical protein